MPPSGRSQAARCTAPAKFRRDFRLIRRGRRPRRPAGAHCAPLQLKRIRVHSWDRSPHLSRPSVVPPSLSPLSLRDIIPTPFGLRPFPPDRGNRPLDKESRPPGEGLGGRPSVPPLRVKRNIPWRAADSRPYADTGRGPFSSQGPVPDRPAQDSHRERWFGKPRRRNKIAPVPIFSHSGPQWGRTERHPSIPNFARRKDSACPKG